jgi:hypothetical protein
MRSSWMGFAAVVALAGCGGRDAKAPAQAGGQASQAAAVAAESGRAHPGGPLGMVFDSVREAVAMGVYRVSLSVPLLPGAARASQQAEMQAVLDAERAADTTLAAIRVLGFMPPSAGAAKHPTGMRMIPFAILTWAPPGGWNAVSAANARGPHSTDALFVTDLPHHQPVPGTGAPR